MNQHLVSRVLLRQFADSKGGPVQVLDLDSREERGPKPVKQLGSLPDLIVIGADKTEKTWNAVERELPHAFELIEKREILSHPQRIETIKNCIALHWSRSFAAAVMFGHMQEHYADQVATDILNEVPPTEVIRALTNVSVPPGPSAYALAHQRLREEFHRNIERKGFKGHLLLDFFQKAKDLVARHELEFHYATAHEFLIADIPVAAYNKSMDAVGALNGVAWGNADALFMPLGPRHAVALTKTKTYIDTEPGMVIAINRLQVRGAYKEVYYRSASGLGDILIKALKQGTQKKDETEEPPAS